MQTLFTPIDSLIGGALIGLAAVGLMASLGRIFGATGILTGAVVPINFESNGKAKFNRFGAETLWRLAILLGMVSAPAVLGFGFNISPTIEIVSSKTMLIIGGLLVGLGVTFAGGCTSGHGVCGNARFSARSLVATLSFMGATFLTVFVLRHVMGVL